MGFAMPFTRFRPGLDTMDAVDAPNAPNRFFGPESASLAPFGPLLAGHSSLLTPH
jgi:hypothetical protein